MFVGIGRGVVAGHHWWDGRLFVWVRWTSFRAPDHLCAASELELLKGWQ